MKGERRKTPMGMRDTPPEEMIVKKKILEKIERKFIEYGFRPLDTPAMEFLSVLTAKSGEEIKEQIFKIEGEDIGLRFDLTVPLARFAANHLDLPKPFKRYAIAKVWRNEESQKGRYREFFQADADIIGSKSMLAEVELLYLARDVLEDLGFEIEKARFLINNRKFLDGIADYWEIENKEDVFRSIDKMDKIGKEGVAKELERKVGKEKGEKILKDLDVGGGNEEKLKFMREFSTEGAEELEEILEYFPYAEIDLYLVRGLAYYTGPIFEIKASDEIGSISAGGRYDRLLSLYGEGFPATGISFGVERIFYLIKERTKKLGKGEKKTYTEVFVSPVEKSVYNYALEITQRLRKEGIPTEIDITGRKLRKQLEYCNTMGIPYVIIIGKREKEEGRIIIKEMKEGKQWVTEREEGIRKIKRLIRGGRDEREGSNFMDER